MLVFWTIAGVLLVVVLALILPTLLRTKASAAVDASAEKRAIFRQQFEELEQDKLNGVLDISQYELAKSELERRLLNEGDVEATATVKPRPDRRLAGALLIALPLIAVVLYYQLGSPLSVSMPAVAPDTTLAQSGAAQSNAEHSAMAGDLEPLLDSLKGKLENNPGDGAGWALLARSYVELKRHAEAVPAYEKAVKVIPDDAQLLADYADALAVVNGHKLAGLPEELVKRALKSDSHNVKALLLAATAAFQRKDYQQAIVFWQRLQQDLPADSDLLPEIKASLNEARSLSGGKVIETPSATGAPKTEQRKVAGISGTVRIAPALAGKLDPSTTVFIFARATQGMPMPLAIVRVTLRDLPYAYHLDDSSALTAEHKLSQAGEVVLLARVSKDGNAQAQSGDFQGMSATIKPNDANIDIEINQVVP
ncbi:MAG: c-type cytochrome biogenesis protein CcmI [Methylophilaceae bacterium]|nr:c-type cytochrome biogenesis protein CcmI [Methylophilaceae bacterium]